MGKRGRIDSRCRRAVTIAAVGGAMLVAMAASPGAVASSGHRGARSIRHASRHISPDDRLTATPIKHLVVVFQEYRSFDRYFGTYPRALNPPTEPRFVPAPATPTVNGLTPALLTHNPNAANPVR